MVTSTLTNILRGMGLSEAREPRLQDVLDGGSSAAQHAAADLATPTNGASADSGDQYYEEHLGRINAEGQAADAQRRLQVAQEQIAEFAYEREREATQLAEECSAVLSALPPEAQSEFISGFQKLQKKLAHSAAEAAAFSAMQKADVERTKRSASQANLHSTQNGTVDGELKRQKEEFPEEAVGDADMEEDEPALTPSEDFLDRATYIPLRLDQDKRRLLRLLEAALSVSEYTNEVDIQSWKTKSARIHKQLTLICGILCGLVVAEDYKKGQQLVTGRHFKDNAQFFQEVFEAGRRYKIMNPDKMRTEYGKLVYLLMDAASPAIQELLDFNPIQDLNTVRAFLEARGGTAILSDPLLGRATAEIVSFGRVRSEVQRDIKDKERCRERLAKKYRKTNLSEEELLNCMYSISDNNSFLLFNRDPIDRMIAYMKTYFKPNEVEKGFDLSIAMGSGGARLSHNHERQYTYVLQSLMLWREINHDMFKLWYLAESDLLAEGNAYRLTNTGQGLNRVQQAPSVRKAMHSILLRCQRKLGNWVGSSVVHLGDHNVPNALMFIDKYNQVPRILTPVVLVLDKLPSLNDDKVTRVFVESVWGDMETARKAILADFFRHGFDGSGADNFFDAGSCIDGRLTSLWNWASRIEKKPYYNLFKLLGFAGFDGDFQK